MSVLISALFITISIESSISGEIYTDANEVCRLFPESNGDFLTNL